MCYKTRSSFAMLLVVFCGLGCQKDVSFQVPNDIGFSITGFFKKNTAEAMQVFSLNANTGGKITGKKGTRLIFQPGSFADRNGNPVTGKVTLNLMEVLTPADMIMNDKATRSYNLPIESGGAFYIHATYNNGKATATLAPGKLAQFALSSRFAALPNMMVFKADTCMSGNINWYADTSLGNTVQADSFAVFNMFSNTTEWINCDRFMDEPKIHFTFKPAGEPSADSTRVFVHFTGRNAVMTVDELGGNFSSDNLLAMPVTVIGICIFKKLMYTAIGTTTLSDKGSYTMTFSPSTKEALRKRLQQLK